jgi:hypothetical protein
MDKDPKGCEWRNTPWNGVGTDAFHGFAVVIVIACEGPLWMNQTCTQYGTCRTAEQSASGQP